MMLEHVNSIWVWDLEFKKLGVEAPNGRSGARSEGNLVLARWQGILGPCSSKGISLIDVFRELATQLSPVARIIKNTTA